MIVMYHKVSCLVYIYPIPLSQVDDSMIKEANQLFPPTQVKKRGLKLLCYKLKSTLVVSSFISGYLIQ